MIFQNLKYALATRGFWVTLWLLALVVFFLNAWPAFFAQGLDFAIYYSVGEAILAGKVETIYNSGEQAPWISYAPLVTPTFYYFALAPFKFSKTAFIFLKPFSYATWPFLLSGIVSKESSKVRPLAAAVLSCIAMSPTVYEETIVGNINVFLLTAMFAALVIATRGWVYIAATIITVIAICKPQYSLFWIPLFFLNSARAVAGGFTGVGILVGHTLLFMSPAELLSMLQRWFPLITNPIAGTSDVNNLSTSGVLERLIMPMNLTQSGTLQGINLLQLSSTASSMVAKIATCVFGLLAAMSIWPVAKSIKSSDSSFAIWVAAITLVTLFVTPVIWLTHFMLMVVPIFVLVFCLLESNRLSVAASILVIVGISIFSAGQFLNNNDTHRVLARAFGWPFFSLVIVAAIFAWQQLRPHICSKPSKRAAQ